MARFKNRPKNREEFKEYVLRKLGAPVIEVELADVQLDDVIDDTTEMFNQFHHDGAFRTYRKVLITRSMIEHNKHIPSFYLDGDASDTHTMHFPSAGSDEGQVGLDASNTLYITADGSDNTEYREYLSGIEIPDDIIGITRIFRLSTGGGGQGDSWMGAKYQNMLGAYDSLNGANGAGLGGVSRQTNLANYEIQMRYLQEMDHSLNYEPPIRFSKVRNRIYVDMDWDSMCEGDYLAFECHQATDPDIYPDMFLDTWYRNYSVALAKIQWGSNLLKYNGVNLPGGITLNGEAILNEGKEEKLKAEEDLKTTYFGDITPIIIG